MQGSSSGQRYFDRCRIGLRWLEAVVVEIAIDADLPASALRLTTPVDLARVLFPLLVLDFEPTRSLSTSTLPGSPLPNMIVAA